MPRRIKQTMCFAVTGDFVTQTARSWLYEEGIPYERVMKFLLSCMHDSGLENDTVIGLAHDLLLGKKKLIGNTRNNSYCLVVDTTDILKAYPYFWKTMHREIPQKFREALPSEIPNYGWLKPNGDYFGVSWGKHEVWAFEYIREHFKNNMLAGISESSGDFLMKKGWVLLHSPAQTVPVITHTKALTKRQKEFLSGYFMQKGMPGQVRAIWEV